MKVEEMQARVKADPGDSVFPELANFLRSEGKHNDALEVCYKGLSINPSNHRGRLTIAWIYYELLYFPFAVREIQILLEARPESGNLRKLLAELTSSDADKAKKSKIISKPVVDSPKNISVEPVPLKSILPHSDTEQIVGETEFDIGDLDLLDD